MKHWVKLPFYQFVAFFLSFWYFGVALHSFLKVKILRSIKHTPLLIKTIITCRWKFYLSLKSALFHPNVVNLNSVCMLQYCTFPAHTTFYITVVYANNWANNILGSSWVVLTISERITTEKCKVMLMSWKFFQFLFQIYFGKLQEASWSALLH